MRTDVIYDRGLTTARTCDSATQGWPVPFEPYQPTETGAESTNLHGLLVNGQNKNDPVPVDRTWRINALPHHAKWKKDHE